MHTTLLAASLLLSPVTASAAPLSVPLTATGPWNVDFAESRCVLSRPFADGTIDLGFIPDMVDDGLELAVMTRTKATKEPKSGNAVVSLFGKPAGKANFRAYTAVGKRLVRVDFEEQSLPLTGQSGTVAIDAEGEGRWLFNVTAIARALPTLTECRSQLRAAFNIKEAELAPIVTRPKGTVDGLFTTNDYPTEAWQTGQTGVVGVLIWIEADGRVSTCEITNTNAAPVLQQKTCEVLKARGRFTPARDARGLPIRAPATAHINWVLPD